MGADRVVNFGKVSIALGERTNRRAACFVDDQAVSLSAAIAATMAKISNTRTVLDGS
jgi:hypothetical protein